MSDVGRSDVGRSDVGRFCCVGETQSGTFLSMSSGGSMLKSDNFSLFQASIAVTIAEPSLPLLISSSLTGLTAWWCRFMWCRFIWCRFMDGVTMI